MKFSKIYRYLHNLHPRANCVVGVLISQSISGQSLFEIWDKMRLDIYKFTSPKISKIFWWAVASPTPLCPSTPHKSHFANPKNSIHQNLELSISHRERLTWGFIRKKNKLGNFLLSEYTRYNLLQWIHCISIPQMFQIYLHGQKSS